MVARFNAPFGLPDLLPLVPGFHWFFSSLRIAIAPVIRL
jgi:hypothetical protein